MAMAIATGVVDQLPQGTCRYIGLPDVTSAYKYPDENYESLPDSCKISFGMIVLVIGGGLTAAFLVSIRPSIAGDQNFRNFNNMISQNYFLSKIYVPIGIICDE
jgi:hypothetical protein